LEKLAIDGEGQVFITDTSTFPRHTIVILLGRSPSLTLARTTNDVFFVVQSWRIS